MRRRCGSLPDALDDDTVLLVLDRLCASEVLRLVAASASLAERLVGAGAIERLAVAQLGPAAAAAAASAAEFSCSRCRSDDEEGAGAHRSGPLAALRALASATPAAEALRHAASLVVADGGPSRGGAVAEGSTESDGAHAAALGYGEAAPEARAFLDNLFCSEVRRKRRHGPGVAVLAAADAALTSLLVTGEGGSRLVTALTQVVREAERDLDIMVDEGHAEVFYQAYEVVARRRSAVEFLRRRLGDMSTLSGAIAVATQALDSAVGELDETIVGYTKEGYDLACPRLASRVASGLVPYAHWWVFLGRPHTEGWAVLR